MCPYCETRFEKYYDSEYEMRKHANIICPSCGNDINTHDETKIFFRKVDHFRIKNTFHGNTLYDYSYRDKKIIFTHEVKDKLKPYYVDEYFTPESIALADGENEELRDKLSPLNLLCDKDIHYYNSISSFPDEYIDSRITFEDGSEKTFICKYPDFILSTAYDLLSEAVSKKAERCAEVIRAEIVECSSSTGSLPAPDITNEETVITDNEISYSFSTNGMNLLCVELLGLNFIGGSEKITTVNFTLECSLLDETVKISKIKKADLTFLKRENSGEGFVYDRLPKYFNITYADGKVISFSLNNEQNPIIKDILEDCNVLGMLMDKSRYNPRLCENMKYTITYECNKCGNTFDYSGSKLHPKKKPIIKCPHCAKKGIFRFFR